MNEEGEHKLLKVCIPNNGFEGINFVIEGGEICKPRI